MPKQPTILLGPIEDSIRANKDEASVESDTITKDYTPQEEQKEEEKNSIEEEKRQMVESKKNNNRSCMEEVLKLQGIDKDQNQKEDWHEWLKEYEESKENDIPPSLSEP